MTESAPASLAELHARQIANIKIEGFGAETRSVACCPFCGAPDWAVWPIYDVEGAMRREAVCAECGRGARAIFKELPGGGKRFEFVQTCGPDQPAWLIPNMRRVT
jgi:hypothetical protein